MNHQPVERHKARDAVDEALARRHELSEKQPAVKGGLLRRLFGQPDAASVKPTPVAR